MEKGLSLPLRMVNGKPNLLIRSGLISPPPFFATYLFKIIVDSSFPLPYNPLIDNNIARIILMNEEITPTLNTALSEAIIKVTSGVEGMVAFGKEQIPEVMEQLLMWHFVNSLILFVFWLILLCFGIYRWKIKNKLMSKIEELYDNGDKGRDSSEFETFLCYLIPVLSIVFGTIGTLTCKTWIKILVAPKFYLIEYAAKLASGV